MASQILREDDNDYANYEILPYIKKSFNIYLVFQL